MRSPPAATSTSAGTRISTSRTATGSQRMRRLTASRRPTSAARRTSTTSASTWGFNGHYDHFGKNFRNTDLGFLNGRTNKDWLYGGMRATQADPWRFVRRIDLTFYANKQWNDERLTIYENINWFFNMQLPNYWSVGIRRRSQLRVLRRSRHARRAAHHQAAKNFYLAFSVNTDSRKRWTG